MTPRPRIASRALACCLLALCCPPGLALAQEEVAPTPSGPEAPFPRTTYVIVLPLWYARDGDSWVGTVNLLPMMVEKPITGHWAMRLFPRLDVVMGSDRPTAFHIAGLHASVPYYFRERPEGWSYAGGYVAPFVSSRYGKHLRLGSNWVSRAVAFREDDERLAVSVWYGGELGYIWGSETTPWFLGLVMLVGTMQGKFLDNGEMANPRLMGNAGWWFGYRFQ